MVLMFLLFPFLHALLEPEFLNVPVSFGDIYAAQDIKASNDTFAKLAERVSLPQKAVIDGNKMFSDLNGPRVQSKWSTRDQLERNGWQVRDTASDETKDQESEDYNNNGGPYKYFNIDYAQNKLISANQDATFENCARKNRDPTKGAFRQAYNVHKGAIIGLYNVSPLHQAVQKLESLGEPLEDAGDLIPEVQFLSDVGWIVWADQCDKQGKEASSLKYIFKHRVKTPFTKKVMEAIAGVDDDEFDKAWPGIKLAPGTPRFKTMLGTPHGKGIVHLITKHPTELSGKTIELIHMFTTDDGYNYHLLFILTG